MTFDLCRAYIVVLVMLVIVVLLLRRHDVGRSAEAKKVKVAACLRCAQLKIFDIKDVNEEFMK